MFEHEAHEILDYVLRHEEDTGINFLKYDGDTLDAIQRNLLKWNFEDDKLSSEDTDIDDQLYMNVGAIGVTHVPIVHLSELMESFHKRKAEHVKTLYISLENSAPLPELPENVLVICTEEIQNIYACLQGEYVEKEEEEEKYDEARVYGTTGASHGHGEPGL